MSGSPNLWIVQFEYVPAGTTQVQNDRPYPLPVLIVGIVGILGEGVSVLFFLFTRRVALLSVGVSLGVLVEGLAIYATVPTTG